jgi:Zn finger protein HypA/HybF involved in hydrogenase expression
MPMYKCGDCTFWGEYDEVLIVREVDHEPYGDTTVERETIYWHCPLCNSEDVTEWVEAG